MNRLLSLPAKVFWPLIATANVLMIALLALLFQYTLVTTVNDAILTELLR